MRHAFATLCACAALAACSGGGTDIVAVTTTAGSTSSSTAEHPRQSATTVAQPDDRVSELGALLLTDDDFDGNDAVSLSGVGDPPFTPEDDDYYEGPPGLLCPDHEAPALVGTGDVFSLLVREDEVFVGEWIAGEPAADANSRYREGIAAFEACDEPFENDDGDQVTLQDRPLAHQALDDLARYVYDVAGEPVTDVVYARNGGLLMLIYLTGGLRAGEADEILRVALDKLAAADRTEWPAAPEPVDPSIDMDEPGEFAEVQYDGVTCSAVAEVPLGLQAATEVDLPREQAAALRWHVTAEAEGARSNAVAPNDAADAGVAYGVDGSLHFVDLDNRLKWVWPADETGDVDITDRVYALARDESDYAVVALDVDTGEPDWAMRWAEPDDVPREVAAVDTKVYAMGAVGVTAHDAATGAALWRAEGDLLGADGNVALVDTRAGQGCGLVAIDAATGGVKWAGLPAPSPSAYLDIAAIPAGAVVFVASRPHATGAEAVQGADRVTVQAFDVSSGRILWAQALPADADASIRMSLVADDAAVFAQVDLRGGSKSPTDVVALDRATGRVLWGARLPEGVGDPLSGAQLSGDELLVPTDETIVHLARADGRPLSVESVSIDWVGELIVTKAGQVLLGDEIAAIG